MRERAEKLLRNICLTLGALVFLQVAYALFQACQLVGVKSPAIPTLAAETNLTAGALSAGPPVHSLSSTQAVAVVPGGMPQKPVSGTTNVAENADQKPGPAESHRTALMATNLAALDPRNARTNLSSMHDATLGGTNPDTADSAMKAAKKHNSRQNHMGGMGFSGGPMMPGMPGHGPVLPPQIQAQVDRIVSSGIFGPVMHPPPMGLLGIAGDTAFLRTDSGASGLVKEGDSLGDLKLLRIGINRVLVEQDGQKKELTIFDGYGGDSLLSNKLETQNENIQIQKQAH